jgi:rhodanese-related sulfurtransferase
MTQISPRQLSEWLADPARRRPTLIDVREPWEFRICRIDGSVHIPMSAIPATRDRLDPDTETVMICHHGSRSFQAGLFLEHAGFSKVFNLAGGLDSWARQVEPAMPAY